MMFNYRLEVVIAMMFPFLSVAEPLNALPWGAGSVMFNYGFVVMVPSWLNEKKQTVSVNKTMWTSTGTPSTPNPKP